MSGVKVRMEADKLTSKADAKSIRPGNFNSFNSFNSLNSLNSFTPAIILFFSLLTINLVCFNNVLSGYFHADDIWHIQYAYEATHGNPELLLKPFCSEWLNSPSFPKMYRPIVPLTEAIDCFFWGMNPLGYHLSNILFHSCASFMLFLVVRRLFARSGNRDAQLIALFSAVVFSVYPMHAEVVAWVTERFDSLCTMFFLASFWLFMVTQDAKEDHAVEPRRFALLLSCILFACSLLCKEMSLTLPLILFAYTFLFGAEHNGSGTQGTFFTWFGLSRFVRSLKSTSPYLAVASLYLLVRYSVTGTLFGTYQGAAGEMLQAATVSRLFQWSNLWLPLLPVNEELPPSAILGGALRVILALSAAVLIARSFRKAASSEFNKNKTMGFLAIWMVVCIIPVIPVMSLQSNLAGARHFYMSSAPLCVLIVAMLEDRTACCNRLHWLRTALLVSLITCYSLLTYHNNKAWELAGIQMQSMVQVLQKTIMQLRPRESLAIVDVPLQHKGVHMLYDLESLQMLLRPPYCQADISSRLDTLEPTFYNRFLIPSTRLHNLLNREGVQVVRWNSSSLALDPVECKSKQGLQNIKISPVSSSKLPDGTDIVLLNSSAPALLPAVDAIEVRAKCSANHPSSSKPVIALLWASDKQNTYDPSRSVGTEIKSDGELHTYHLHVSRHEDWALAKSIPNLRLWVAPGITLESLSFACLPIERLTPSLTMKVSSGDDETRECPGGICHSLASSFSIAYDASLIPNAAGIIVEVSKPGGRLDVFHFERECSASPHAMKSWHQEGLRGSISINSSMVPEKNVYQVRAAAITDTGRVTGYFCDPVFLSLDPNQPRRKH